MLLCVEDALNSINVLGFGDDKSKICYWGLNHMLLHISV